MPSVDIDLTLDSEEEDVEMLAPAHKRPKTEASHSDDDVIIIEPAGNHSTEAMDTAALASVNGAGESAEELNDSEELRITGGHVEVRHPRPILQGFVRGLDLHCIPQSFWGARASRRCRKPLSRLKALHFFAAGLEQGSPTSAPPVRRPRVQCLLCHVKCHVLPKRMPPPPLAEP